MPQHKIDRRKWLYAAGAGAIAAGAAYITRDYWAPQPDRRISPEKPTPAPPTTTSTKTSPKIELEIDYLPRRTFTKYNPYITIEFRNSTKLDGLQAKGVWSVNDELRSENWNGFSTTFKPGNNTVRFDSYVDEKPYSEFIQLDVDKYGSDVSEKELSIDEKGINYIVGMRGYAWPGLTKNQMEEETDIICYELGCNTLRIMSESNELITQCAEIAQKKPFKSIVASPRLIDYSIDSTIDRVGKLARLLENLRKSISSPCNIELCIANEASMETAGFRKGSTYEQRGYAADPPDLGQRLNNYLKDLIAACRQHFNGKIWYAAGFWEPINWSLDLDGIGSNEYFVPGRRDNPQSSIEKLKNIAVSGGREYAVFEFGTGAFKGAADWGGAGWMVYENRSLSELDQFIGNERYYEIFNRIRPHRIYLYVYRDWHPKLQGIVTPQDWSMFNRTNGNLRRDAFYGFMRRRKSGSRLE